MRSHIPAGCGSRPQVPISAKKGLRISFVCDNPHEIRNISVGQEVAEGAGRLPFIGRAGNNLCGLTKLVGHSRVVHPSVSACVREVKEITPAPISLDRRRLDIDRHDHCPKCDRRDAKILKIIVAIQPRRAPVVSLQSLSEYKDKPKTTTITASGSYRVNAAHTATSAKCSMASAML